MLLRSYSGSKMNGIPLWITIAVLQGLILSASCIKTHRRSLASHQNLPVSKGGWRPVVGSNGFLFGYNTAPLHAPSYKLQVPIADSFPSSTRPLPTRDTNKLTSIAQAYRPTTLRTVSPSPSPAVSQPINSYLNPFALPNSGLTHYKFVQNFPADSVLIRNPHNPYAARPVYKYPTKYKQQFSNQLQFNNYQQLNNVQPIHFGQYQTPNKPAETFAKPTTKPANQASAGTEIVKQEVYKLDSETAPQSINQQVKTAQQQQSHSPPRIQASPYPQYTYQESVLPPSILGTFGSFGVQSVKGRDPFFPTKTTYVPPQPTKTTLFNSFSFAPNFKPTQFLSTTPKLQTTANQIHFGSAWNDFQNPSTQAPKIAVPVKIDPNGNKGAGFKASPQDPFIKPFNDYKISTYNPTVQTTTFAYNNFHDYNYPSQQNQQIQNYFNQQDSNLKYEKKKNKIHDSVPATNQQSSEKYVSAPKKPETDRQQDTVPFKANYEVTESYSDDVITHSSSPSWQEQHDAFYNQKSTEEAVTKHEYEAHSKPTTTPVSVEELAIVTEGEKGYENSLSYDGQIESQSRRPLGDDFEPIGKHKLKDYYYRVSTPSYDSHHYRRTKKPTEGPKVYEVTTQESDFKDSNKDLSLEPLPTLPPNKHFKRPSSPAPETVDKEKIRKRNKIRRRRPGPGNNGQNRDGNNRKQQSSTTEATYTNEEVHTIRPRVRPTQARPPLTTPTVTTDLTTSANPTIAPTKPTIVKKKLIHRRPLTTTTTTEKYETTTPTPTKENDSSKDSSIMKISASSRIPLSRVTATPYDYRTSETPDYTHKQDEKDTPTSDIVVDTLKTTTNAEPVKPFSFHRDSKPIEAKLEPVVKEVTTESSKESNEFGDDVTTTTPRAENVSSPVKLLRPRLKNKYGRPNFSVKDYRNRLSSTTSTTEKPSESTPKLRYPPRKSIGENKSNDVETTTEKKKFTPKDPRHKLDGQEINEQTDKDIHSLRHRQRQTTTETTEAATPKISARIRNGSRRPKPTDETTETTSPLTTLHNKRPLRKKIKDTEVGESVQDVSVTETVDNKNEFTSERTRSESAIMKIADKKHHDHIENLFEHSKRVSDLTLAASKDYNTPGLFKAVNTNSRRIPNYFTIATDDPILPIEAFFPQLNQKKES